MQRRIGTCFIFAVIAVSPLFAGKRIQIESTDLTDKTVTKDVILLDSSRLRYENDKDIVMFLTDGGDRMVMLNKARKEYYIVDQVAMDSLSAQLSPALSDAQAKIAEAMKNSNLTPEQRAMMDKMMKGRGMPSIPAPAPPSETTYTAQASGTANGFPCTHYEGMEDDQKISEICAASPSAMKLEPGDIEIAHRMQEFQSHLRILGRSSSATGFVAKGVDGFPVETIHYSGGKATRREDVKSVTSVTFTDADFSTGDAKKTDMPGLGGRGRGR